MEVVEVKLPLVLNFSLKRFSACVVSARLFLDSGRVHRDRGIERRNEDYFLLSMLSCYSLQQRIFAIPCILQRSCITLSHTNEYMKNHIF